MESSLAIDNKCDNFQVESDNVNETIDANKLVNCENYSQYLNQKKVVSKESENTEHLEVVEDGNSKSSTLNGLEKHKPRKRIAIVESDSDSEGKLYICNDDTELKSITDNLDPSDTNKIKIKKLGDTFQSDSEDELCESSSRYEKEANSSYSIRNNLDGEDLNMNSSKNDLLETNSDNKHSGSDSELEDNTSTSKLNATKSTNFKKKACISSSESDDEEEKNSDKIGTSSKPKSNRKGIIDSDTDDEDIPTHGSNNESEVLESTVFKSSRWAALCDSESSADEINENDHNESNLERGMSDEDHKPIPYKKKPKSKEENGPKKMTGKEALEQRREIFSESQRMTRQSNVSLPYHRPKSHSLKEFLAKRPKLATTVPLASKIPPSVAIKMTMEQLEVVSKKFEERHKEVQEFYKSDSDEDKDDVDYVPESETQPIANDDVHETLQKEDSVVISKDEELKNTYSKSLDENESITNNEGIDDKEDNNNFKMKEIIDTEVNTQEVVISVNTFAEVEQVDEEVTVNMNEPDNKNNSGSEINKEVGENNQSDNRNDQESMEYEFNLDDMDEHSERITKLDNQPKSVDKGHENLGQLEEQSIEKQQQTIDLLELDIEIENFTRNNSPYQEKPKRSKMELLKERLSNIKPRLSSSANNIIDLDNIAKPTQVVQLMERFAKHTAKKQYHKDKVKVNIVNVEIGGEINKETVAVHVDDEDDTVIEEKPGVRLQRLRNELQNQIAQQKQQLWENKTKKEVKNVLEDDDPYQDERSECGIDDPILDNDEEEEMTESSENEDEEDKITEEPKRKTSEFIDDEVEETDIEDEEQIESKDEDEEAVDADADNEEEMEENEERTCEMVKDNSDKENGIEDFNKSSENKGNGNNCYKGESTTFKKPLRRIIKGFTEDSDDDEDTETTSVVSKIVDKLNKSNEEKNLTKQEDYIPSYQLENHKTPVRETFQEKSDLKFLTPVSYITGLQNLTNSASKVQSPTNVPSPLREANWHDRLQKKLFADSVITNSQAEAMAQLCSESFSNSQVFVPDNSTSTTEHDTAQGVSQIVPLNSQNHSTCTEHSQEAPSTQDLLDVCSGEFTGITQISSNGFPKTCVSHLLNPVEEVKTLDEDQDIVISQLLNEEEMEAFKKKFDSPILNHSPKAIREPEEVAGTGGVIDSDDDENVLEVKKKKNQKKLTFSDDDSSEEEREDEEEINLCDDVDIADINYDSEENEIEYEKETENIKLTDFFEDEAELSESEWGSADEDEKDLDRLEFEQGDTEKFDEKQMRTDLERIHMRRMLDDDTREVKLLQEMLLDDGELHGSGRERQFKWKNIDSQNIDDDTKKNSDDEIGFDEDESEEQWRRKRHEREMFLKEKQSQEFNDDIDLLSKSEILKLGHKVIQKSLSNPQGYTLLEKTKDENDSSSTKTQFSLLHKRGSFLNRGDQVLQKLAEYNKLSTTTTTVVQKVKNSKSFLFQTVEVQATDEKLSILSKKRKAVDGTPKIIKKLRLTDNLSPAVKKKNKFSSKSKLFAIS
ncbi:claspin [Diorhabda sublineata]|uniref:claspin n=1 Tax=Diorhabda sublineata TaxID=1163346 RepID=UPI0024E06ADE|nr:claspin [Diorhabda sublineata]